LPVYELSPGDYALSARVLPYPDIVYDDDPSPPPPPRLLPLSSEDFDDDYQVVFVASPPLSLSKSAVPGCSGSGASVKSLDRSPDVPDAVLTVSGPGVLSAGYARGHEAVVVSAFSVRLPEGAVGEEAAEQLGEQLGEQLDSFSMNNWFAAIGLLVFVFCALSVGCASPGSRRGGRPKGRREL
jgi:hypothetical protein